jgi:hypothetical protein
VSLEKKAAPGETGVRRWFGLNKRSFESVEEQAQRSFHGNEE